MSPDSKSFHVPLSRAVLRSLILTIFDRPVYLHPKRSSSFSSRCVSWSIRESDCQRRTHEFGFVFENGANLLFFNARQPCDNIFHGSIKVEILIECTQPSPRASNTQASLVLAVRPLGSSSDWSYLIRCLICRRLAVERNFGGVRIDC